MKNKKEYNVVLKGDMEIFFKNRAEIIAKIVFDRIVQNNSISEYEKRELLNFIIYEDTDLSI